MVLAVGLACQLGATASADEEADHPLAGARPTVTVRAAPIFGSEASVGDGWSEVAVNVDNVGGVPKKGMIELTSSLPWGHEQGFVTRAPFNVAPGRSVVVKLPTHGFPFQSASINLLVKDDAGVKLASLTVSVSSTLLQSRHCSTTKRTASAPTPRWLVLLASSGMAMSERARGSSSCASPPRS